jgi:hypothetical protein
VKKTIFQTGKMSIALSCLQYRDEFLRTNTPENKEEIPTKQWNHPFSIVCAEDEETRFKINKKLLSQFNNFDIVLVFVDNVHQYETVFQNGLIQNISALKSSDELVRIVTSLFDFQTRQKGWNCLVYFDSKNLVRFQKEKKLIPNLLSQSIHNRVTVMWNASFMYEISPVLRNNCDLFIFDPKQKGTFSTTGERIGIKSAYSCIFDVFPSMNVFSEALKFYGCLCWINGGPYRSPTIEDCVYWLFQEREFASESSLTIQTTLHRPEAQYVYKCVQHFKNFILQQEAIEEKQNLIENNKESKTTQTAKVAEGAKIDQNEKKEEDDDYEFV